MLVIDVVQQKGGGGKTPTAVHTSFALARRGKRVLFVDFDPQATASLHFLGRKYKEQQPTIYNALMTLTPIEPLQVRENLYLLPAHDELEKAEVELTSKKGFFYQAQLARLLTLYQHQFDFCVIDTPGSRISVFTIIALTAGHLVIVPAKTEIAHEDATKDTMNLIDDVRAGNGLNPSLKVWGILPNQFENNLHHKEIVDILKEEYGDLVYPEPSRKTTKYNDATSMKVDIRELDQALGEYWDRLAASVIEKGGLST
jgi:chromosome partitioning protein